MHQVTTACLNGECKVCQDRVTKLSKLPYPWCKEPNRRPTLKIYCSWEDLSIELNIGAWYFTFYGNFKVWGLRYHTNSPCCKWWLLIGPFEINRPWYNDDKDYPEGDVV